MSAFGQWVKASSIGDEHAELRSPALDGARGEQFGILDDGRAPVDPNVSPTPGIRNRSPMRGSASRFVSVSASRFPGRSGISERAVVEDPDEPGRVAAGEMSRPPSGRLVATQTNGERSTNCRVSGVQAVGHLRERPESLGAPMISRRRSSLLTVDIVAMLRV